MSQSIKFDNVELMNASYTPKAVRHDSSPIREMEILELAREDGGVLVSERFRPKVIEIEGTLKASSRSALDSLIDDFKELLSRRNKNLDISYGGSTRRYIAFAEEIRINRDYYHNLFVPYYVRFIVPSGVGKDINETAALDGVDADPTYTGSVSFEGSAPPKPKITLTIGSGWDYAKGIQFENTTRSEKCIINKGTYFSDGDVLIIDCDEKKVTLNDEEIEFYGVIPSFQIGSNDIEIKAGNIVDQQFVPDEAKTLVDDKIYGDNYVAQSFMVSHTDKTYQGYYLRIKKIGDPSTYGNPSLYVEVRTDLNGKPYQVVSGSATSISVNDVGTSFDWILVNTAATFKLNANTKYWLVVFMSAGNGDINNCYVWRGNSGIAANYGRGHVVKTTDYGGNYTDYTDQDKGFKLLFGGKPDTSPQLTLDIDYYKRWL